MGIEVSSKIPLLQHLPEPCWNYFNACDSTELPSECAEFLLNPGSMTDQLRKLKPSFGLKVLKEGYEAPTQSEQQLLAMKDKIAFVRESELYSDDGVWMYGRSIFPPSTLSGNEQVFTALGNRSMGDILFNDSRVRRSAFEFATLHHQGCLYWIRRSIFFVEEKKILLTEFFMPALIKELV